MPSTIKESLQRYFLIMSCHVGVLTIFVSDPCQNFTENALLRSKPHSWQRALWRVLKDDLVSSWATKGCSLPFRSPPYLQAVVYGCRL